MASGRLQLAASVALQLWPRGTRSDCMRIHAGTLGTLPSWRCGPRVSEKQNNELQGLIDLVRAHTLCESQCNWFIFGSRSGGVSGRAGSSH